MVLALDTTSGYKLDLLISSLLLLLHYFKIQVLVSQIYLGSKFIHHIALLSLSAFAMQSIVFVIIVFASDHQNV